MKKLLIMVLILMTFSLSGCAKLPQDYFENTTLHHVDETMDQFEVYGNHMKEYYKDNYPDDHEMFDIRILDSYVPHTTSLNTIYRHELKNYGLTDNRGYMLENHMRIIIEKLDNIYSFGTSHCSDVKEGKVCTTSELPNESITVLQEGNDIVVEYTTLNYMIGRNITYKANYFFHFREEQDRITLDFRLEKIEQETDEIYEVINLYYQEGNIEHSMNRTVYESENGYFKEVEITYDLKTMNYTKKIETNEHAKIYHYNRESQEFFEIAKENGEYNDFGYTTYIGKKKIVSIYDNMTFYHVNFSEVAGWDYLEQIDYTNEYNVYYNDTQIEGLTLFLEMAAGEYLLQYFETDTTFDDELLSLSKYGMSLPYNNQFFKDKEAYFISNLDQILEDAHIEQIGMDKVATDE